MEYIEITVLEKGLHPKKSHDPEISPCILEEHEETLIRPHEMFKILLEEGIVLKKRKKANIMSIGSP